MSEKMTKKVVLSQVVEDLQNGLTKWKKDDIGFGSLEKKYNLSQAECIQLFGHPKVINVESRIPTFIIEDDLTFVNETPQTTIEVAEVREPLLQANNEEVKETRIETGLQRVEQMKTIVKETVKPVLKPIAPIF